MGFSESLHRIIKCSCGAVITQCKCPSPDKTVEVREKSCARCQTAPAAINLPTWERLAEIIEAEMWTPPESGDSVLSLGQIAMRRIAAACRKEAAK